MTYTFIHEINKNFVLNKVKLWVVGESLANNQSSAALYNGYANWLLGLMENVGVDPPLRYLARRLKSDNAIAHNRHIALQACYYSNDYRRAFADPSVPDVVDSA